MLKPLAIVFVVVLAAVSAAAQEAPEGSAPTPSVDTVETPDKKCEVAVMSLDPKGLPADQVHVAELLTDTMAAEIASAANCKVITQADIARMLEFESEKQLCGVESESCVAEIAGALGVDRVVNGSVGMLGDSFKLQVQLHNVPKGEVEGRVDRLIQGDPVLLDAAAKNAARELFGVEKIPEPTAAEAGVRADAKAASTADSGAPMAEEDGGILGTLLLAGGGVVGAAGALGAVIGSSLLTVGLLDSELGIILLTKNQGTNRPVILYGLVFGGGALGAISVVSAVAGIGAAGASFAME